MRKVNICCTFSVFFRIFLAIYHPILMSKPQFSTSALYLARAFIISWKFPGHVLEHSQKFPGHFLDISWEFSGTFPELFWKFPGHFLDISRTFPGHFPEISQEFPDFPCETSALQQKNILGK